MRAARVALAATVLILPFWWLQPRWHAHEWADLPAVQLGPAGRAWADSHGGLLP